MIQEEDMNIVVLDTEVLKRDPKRIKGPFLALSKLANKEQVRIHISEISVREFLSDQQNKLNTVFDKGLSSINSLHKYPIPGEFQKSLAELTQTFEQSKIDTFKEITRGFNKWCESSKVKIDSVKQEHTAQMLDAYFTGSPPFKKLKSREDIPDAFIWETVSELCKSYSKVCFISGDNNLREACAKHYSQLKTFKDIKTFLEKEGYFSDLRLGILEKQLSIVFDHIISSVFIDSKLDDLVENELIGRNYYVLYPLQGTTQISSIKKPIKAMLGKSGNYYGDGLLSIPFSARTVCKFKYIVNKNSLDDIKNNSEVTIIPLENDSYELELSRIIVFAGSVLFGVKSSILEEETTIEKTYSELQNIEMVIESLSIYGESDSQVSIDLYNKHAHEEALELIEEGNLDVELDADEEKNRSELARWFDVPNEFIGKHENFEIKEGARLKIAPPPRFEEWVKVLKKSILEEIEEDKSNQNNG